MVLQLAVPHASLDSSASTSKLPELPITPDYVHHVPPRLSPYNSQQKRSTAGNSNAEIQQDLFSSLQVQKPITHQYVYVNQGLDLSSSEIGIPDQSQLTVTERGSLAAIPGTLDEREKENADPPPTPLEEKVKMFRSHLTVILSCVYAVFVVTLGVVIYISDIVLQSTPLAETFSTYLVILGLIYFLFLYTDIRRYTNGIKNRNALLFNKDDTSFKGSIECQTSTRSDLQLNLQLPTKLEEIRLMHHYYCFSSGRHSGSFYLKVGAAGFCFGHLIHSGLLLGYQIVFLTSDTEDFYNCASIATLILDIIYPIYSFLQLFFIFKYSNVIINRCKELARFALMHCIASSLCFWIWTIMRETMDSLSTFINHKYDKIATEAHSIRDENSEHKLVALPLTFYQKSGARMLINCINDTSWVQPKCQPPHGLAIIADNFSPYLYPFSIEYSILVVGILFIIWQKIGQCAPSHGDNDKLRECPLSLGTTEEIGSTLVIHADCQSSNKGLFAGLIILVGSVTSIILFFIAMADKEYVEMGLAVNATSELILLLLMTIAVMLAYRKLTQLDINHHPVSLLDGLLLFICIPAHFLYAIFSIIPAVLKANYVSIANILLQVVQVLLQTPFIIDGLRRCSNTRALRIKKPGRELVTFLVVCNVALWITETFEIKSHDKRDDRDDVYGKVLWTMLSHMTVPLTMFYRFHSSVCLVDIWKSAYEPGERHKPKM